MKNTISIICLCTACLAGWVAGRADTNSPAIHAQEIQAQINQQAFAQGVRFGLMAKQRNQDIMDLNILAQIAYSLFTQEQRALGQQQPKATNVPVIKPADETTNAAPTNTTEKVEKP